MQRTHARSAAANARYDTITDPGGGERSLSLARRQMPQRIVAEGQR